MIIKGCASCPYSNDCPDAYTEVSHLCGEYERSNENDN